ncbi:MAG: hypothetical protein LBG80_07290 [Bacteroidales bacterium]|nr:hypothetical protein [Bacteroidales bacterium]
MENVLKINAGIACSDKANVVEPRPNENDMSLKRWRFCNDYNVSKNCSGMFCNDYNVSKNYLRMFCNHYNVSKNCLRMFCNDYNVFNFC